MNKNTQPCKLSGKVQGLSPRLVHSNTYIQSQISFPTSPSDLADAKVSSQLSIELAR